MLVFWTLLDASLVVEYVVLPPLPFGILCRFASARLEIVIALSASPSCAAIKWMEQLVAQGGLQLLI